MWDHVRGNDVDADGRLADGPPRLVRRGHALLRPATCTGVDAVGAGPAGRGGDQRRHVAQRGRSGRRPTRQRSRRRLKPGAYTDDAQNNGTADGGTPNGQGIWTFSPPLAHDAHLAGVPKVTVDVDDRAARTRTSWPTSTTSTPAGNATLHQPRHLPAAGQRPGQLRPLRRRLEAAGRPPRRRAAHLVELRVVAAPPDAPAGHRRAPRRSRCRGARARRGAAIEGGPSIKLDSYKATAPFAVPAATIAAGDRPVVRAARSAGRVQLTSS